MISPDGTAAGRRSDRGAADGDSTPIVDARRVSKDYGAGSSTVRALHEVSLRIGRGEIVAIMGPSGCGKTTLLNCLAGLDTVTSGSIRIDGRDIGGLSDRELTAFRARSMGFVFQDYNLLPVLTGLENVELPLLAAGASAAGARARAAVSIEAVGVAAWAGHRPAELSGGQRQRFAIARALATRPAIVWADEPTGALDSATGQDVIDLMLRLNAEQGLTFVWVTHSHDVAAYAQRLITMRDGQIAGDQAVPGAITARVGVPQTGVDHGRPHR
jgi:putative ABC transport system ATP-binding protein